MVGRLEQAFQEWGRMKERYEAQAAALHEIAGCNMEVPCNLLNYDYSVRNYIWEKLRVLAVEMFSPVGARIDIPEKSLKECLEGGVFSPKRVWSGLRQRYEDNQKAALAAYGDIAKSIGRSCRLERDQPMKIVAGWPVITMYVHDDRMLDRVLSFGSVDSIQNLVFNLFGALKWGGVESSEVDSIVAIFRQDIERQGRSNCLPPRQKIGAHVLVVPYKSKFEFRLSPEAAECLGGFLDQFGGFCK